jgi:competence protein ComEC
LKNRLAGVALYGMVLSLGAFYIQSSYLLPSNHVGFLSYQGRHEVSGVEGIVDSDVQIKNSFRGIKQVFEFQISQIYACDRWQASSGRVLIEFYPKQEIHYGERIILSGRLHRTFSDPKQRFSYQQYLENHGIFFIFTVNKGIDAKLVASGKGHWWMKASFLIRQRVKNVLSQYLELREVGMIQAMILGDRSSLPKDMYTLFAQTGTAHVLAISGMNMAIIAAIVLFLLKIFRIARPWQFTGTIIFLFIYAVLSGWSASVVRSVFMAAVVLSSFLLEYESDTMNSLGFAAIVLLLINPMNLLDWGFQLSFLSVGVIIFFYPITQSVIERFKNKIFKYVIQALVISLLAWVGISGITAYYFGMISPIGIIANLLIVPLADMVVGLGVCVGFLGILCPPLAAAFAGTLKAVFNGMVLFNAWFVKIPGAYFYVHKIELWQVFLYYLVLIIVYLFILILPLNRKKTHDQDNFIS